MSIKMICSKCEREWSYKGKMKHRATCPDCKTPVRLPKQNSSEKKVKESFSKEINKEPETKPIPKEITKEEFIDEEPMEKIKEEPLKEDGDDYGF